MSCRTIYSCVIFSEIELFRRERVKVPAKGSASTAFLVTVVRTGEAPVIVEANGSGVSDSLFRTIDVKVTVTVMEDVIPKNKQSKSYNSVTKSSRYQIILKT